MRGFSLIELMVVISIASTVILIGTNGYRKYYAKSARVEAKTMLRYIYTLQEAYKHEQEVYYPFEPSEYATDGYAPSMDGGCSSLAWVGTSGGGTVTSCHLGGYLTEDFYGTPDCFLKNSLGFSMSCNGKSKYMYFVTKNDNDPTTYVFTASTSGSNVIHDKWTPHPIVAGCTVPDRWRINQNGTLVNTSSVIKGCF